MRALLLGVATAVGDFSAPRFTVDLDKSAYDRWVPVAEEIIAKRGYQYTWGPLHAWLESLLPRKVWEELEPLWERVLKSYPADYQDESRAFNKWCTEKGYNWTLGQNVMVQLFYEVEDACTSIVAQHSNGTIFHGRNLDYGLPGLENFTATVTFTRNATAVARGTMYVGYSGVLTGQHLTPDGSASWSLSLNQRFLGQQVIPYIPTVEAFLKGVQNIGFTMRDALINEPDYATALPVVQNKHIAAPAYLTIAGVKPGEGAVVTRDRNGTSQAWNTGRGTWEIAPEKGQWYRLETNFDNWWPDLATDGRRKAAHKLMDTAGQDHADLETLRSTLSTSPVLADDTTYTALMHNEAGWYDTIVREHPADVQREVRALMTKRVAKKLEDLVSWYRQQPWYAGAVLV